MKKLIETFKNIWAIQELRDKITLTAGLILVYRLGSNVVLPGIDPSSLDQLQNQASEGLVGLINAFSGGAFANASILALGITTSLRPSLCSLLVSPFRRSAKCKRRESQVAASSIKSPATSPFWW